VIIVEYAFSRIAAQQKRLGRPLDRSERLHEALQASIEMVRPTVYGQIVIFLVFVPCLSFQGVEGKMFSPMVITLMLALGSAFVLSLTFVPAMAAILVRGKVAEREVPIVRAAKHVYAPILRKALARPLSVIAGGIATFAIAIMIFFSLGRVFMPVLDEINVDLAAVRIPSISMEQSKNLDFRVERTLLALPEVELVFSKAGTASLVFDAMPSNASDNYVMLKAREQWPAGVRSKEDVQKRIREATAPIVGNFYEMTQPIQMRFNELISGARSEVTVAVYGDDLGSMDATAKQVAAVVTKVRGAVEVHVGQTRGFPRFDIRFDRDSIARYGLTMEEVADAAAAALGGRQAGLLFNGDRRYQIVVRLPVDQRNDIDALGALPVILPGAGGAARGSVPLRQLASFGFSEGLNEISCDNGKRRIFVEINVRGRDIASFVADAQSAIAREVRIPPGSWLEWGASSRIFNRRFAGSRSSFRSA
jgi:cobalt-zinc-cadmium resistance protein CzcA